MQDRAGTWLHAHLATTAKSLIGLDTDEAGVNAARDSGFTAHTVDCRDSAAVKALPIEPADLVIAGEVIEHLDAPGPFLDAVGSLVSIDGALALTTPNASGLFNALGALAGLEVNHPDHVVLFSCQTLTALLERHGWSVSMVRTYISIIKPSTERSVRARLLQTAGATLRRFEMIAARLGRPFAADGLIVVARRTRV
jgi:hypothetical protein